MCVPTAAPVTSARQYEREEEVNGLKTCARTKQLLNNLMNIGVKGKRKHPYTMFSTTLK